MFLALPLGVGREALHSPAASSSTAAGTSEEEGLHACPPPHIFEVAFPLVSGDFGGGRIGTFSLPPHNAGEYFGGGGTGLPPRNVGVYLMPMAEEETPEHDELNVTRPQTAHSSSESTDLRRAVTVEGDQAIFLRIYRS